MKIFHFHDDSPDTLYLHISIIDYYDEDLADDYAYSLEFLLPLH